jgi:hypothetical protein
MDGSHSIEWDSNEKLLLNALGTPANAGGLVATLEFVADCISAALNAKPLDTVADWHRLCCGMHRKATDLAQTDPTLAAPPPDAGSRLAPKTYRHIASASWCQEQRAGTERLNAATALIILYAASENGRVPDSIAKELAWLRTTPHRRASVADWNVLASHFPLSAAEVEAVLPKITSQRLQQLLLHSSAAYSTALKAIRPAGNKDTGSDASPSGTAGDSRSPRAATSQNVAYGSEDPEDVQDDTATADEELGSLVRWSIAHHTVHTALRDRFGAINCWHRLHPNALRSVVRSLLLDFDSASDDLRKLTVFAFCCLHSALPAKYALRIPLAYKGNDDLTLDIDRGALVWNFRAVLGTTHSLAARDDSDQIAIRLDARVLANLRHIRRENPTAETLGDLLRVPTGADRKDWLTRYRYYLRSHGERARRPYDARFAYSLGTVYLHVTKSDVWPAFLAFDFAHVAMGLLSYAHPDASTLRRQEAAVARFLGLSLESAHE